MPRLLLALLACATLAAAQPAASSPALIDVVVTDADGRSVSNLAPADFEITSGGQARSVERLTFFDAVRHTAATRGALPALELTPDQIHRTVVLVIDDLCSTPDRISQVRGQLGQLVKQLVPGDRLAILRSSGGHAREHQLTGNAQDLSRAIDALRYTGATNPNSCTHAL